ncbi:MAG TPA: hypothetical protein PKW90_28100, partial [Myxococcota bacterium]|nr:hypothetical protein [Myxococcota bacterium]
MRWLTAAMGRIAIFGTLWVLSVGALCCIGGAELDEVALGRLMRVLLFLWTVLMLSREGTLVDRAIQKLHAPLQELGLPTPGRAEAWLGGCLPTVMGMIFWMAILCGLSSWVAENKEKGPLLFGGGLAWTVATQVWLGLVGGGLSLARYRLAGRALAEALRPKLPPVAPWSIAAVSLPLFAVAFWGIPDPRLVMEGLRVASVVMDAAATAATAPSRSSPAPSSRQATPYTSRRDSQAETVRSSYLVQLGEDDTIQEILPLLNAADATATPAVPQASAADDAVLAATWEVEVPANRARLLTFFLRLDQENVALVEPNVMVKVEPFAQEGCRSGRTALSVNDPLGGQNLAA